MEKRPRKTIFSKSEQRKIFEKAKNFVLNDLLPNSKINKILMFGPGDKTWIFDIDTKNWKKHNLNPSPEARKGHALAPIYGKDQVLLFGGKGGLGYLNSTWIFDYGDMQWFQIHPPITPRSLVEGHNESSFLWMPALLDSNTGTA